MERTVQETCFYPDFSSLAWQHRIQRLVVSLEGFSPKANPSTTASPQTLYIYIYTQLYIQVYMVCIYLSIYLSIYLCIYIYIYRNAYMGFLVRVVWGLLADS